MYYNKTKVEELLEEGISDSAGIIEDLHYFISQVFEEAKDRQVDAELQDLIDEWEG